MKKFARIFLFLLLAFTLCLGAFGCSESYTLPEGASSSINVFTRFSTAAGDAVRFEVLEIYNRAGQPEARVNVTYEKTLNDSTTEQEAEQTLRDKVRTENISAVTEESYNDNVRLFEVESLRFERRENDRTVMVTTIRYDALTMLSSSYYRLVQASRFTDTDIGNRFRDRDNNIVSVINAEADNLYVLTLRYYNDSAVYQFDGCTIAGYYSEGAELDQFTDSSISFDSLSSYLYLAVAQNGFPWTTVAVIAAAAVAVALLVAVVLKLTAPSRKNR